MQLAGVNSVGLGEEGILVFTSNPALVPQEVEGLPVKTFPPLEPAMPADHSLNSRIRPLHGAVAFRKEGEYDHVTHTEDDQYLSVVHKEDNEA